MKDTLVISFLVTFNEDVINFNAEDDLLIIETGGLTHTGVTITPDLVEPNRIYQVDVLNVSNEGTMALDVKTWTRDWTEAGCSMHLETSEFIEAYRGKVLGKDPKEVTAIEAGDVLFVLFSMLDEKGIKPSDVLELLEKKCFFRW